ncbi:uncharacterized protein LOC117113857 [Anneissia japonica]|uniref:uncharacterized protein LOC117113857 n=1 Tax=Anneissia japonica TaxID=1529436 RepID=UPI0014256CCB|nr:uncharacterized protein LOC117113857 [Anneissia japonica]
MDEVLRKSKIPRQAYHGKSFVGKHVYRSCKFNIIDKLMDSVEITLKQQMHQCPASHKKLLEIKLKKIRESFTPVFKLFSDVHACINHTRCIDDSEIDAYENSIKIFSREYRRIAPGVVQPKLHMLEHHAIPFMREWKVGIGLLAEQGGELIHAEFNRRKRAVYGMKTNLEQLMSIMKAHLTFTSPEIQQEVQIKKFRKSEE